MAARRCPEHIEWHDYRVLVQVKRVGCLEVELDVRSLKMYEFLARFMRWGFFEYSL